jgi:DNA-binding CsgD family transcriptional regulator
LEPVAQRLYRTRYLREGANLAPEMLEAEVKRFTSALDFERYGVVLIHDDFSSDDSCRTLGSIDNVPPSYLPYFESRGGNRANPVNQHCKRSFLPIAYGPETYAGVGREAEWEHQAAHGFAHGIAAVYHLPHSLHVLFGIDRTESLPRSRDDLLDLVGRVQLFGTFIQSAAIDLWQPAQATKEVAAVRLSQRQRECLQWAAEGKTAWETGMILSIAEASVAKVMASAIRKLDCATKSQAVVKALRLGLIH